MGSIQQLHELGQSLWYDNIQRRQLENGEIAGLIERDEIRGMTSNPSIFNNAIARSTDYDSALKAMAWSGWSAEEIFYQLAVEDIQMAADLFAPLYEKTGGADGYVSLEVSPYLANDTEGTISEAKRLWERVNRPNLMVKIPATKAGIPAIRQATAAGINVNVTLIFSLTRYMEVMEAYLSGLEERVERGEPIDRIASVASFFVSRVDTKVDQALNALIQKEGEEAERAAKLLGRAAIANARLAYLQFKEVFSGERFRRLAEHGGRLQRPLWASTSTKNPAYRDVIYVEELIGKDTVNTVPPQTLDAFRDHGKAAVTLGDSREEDQKLFEQLSELSIPIDRVTEELEVEGVKAFADAFTALLNTIENRRQAALKELGSLKDGVQQRIAKLIERDAVRRMHAADPTLWTDDESQHAEIRKRLGWLNLPQRSRELLPEIEQLRRDCAQAGYTHALLLGMGGSSLAPEVYREIFGLAERDGIPPLDLAILDSTDPAQVLEAADRAPVEKTLFIVASKSGTTSEVQAFLDTFWARAQSLGRRAGEHFIAITDPGTPLEQTARQNGFRKVFLSDPNTGGRYSALTAFGLVPAGLIGMDVERLLDHAQRMADQCTPEVTAGRNPGLVLGAIVGEAALKGRDKLTLLTDPQVCPFGSWLEQLVAESSGKDGRGIVPVDLEPYSQHYSDDRLFVYFQSDGSRRELADALIEKGHPVLILPVEDPYALGGAFYQWEVATAIACAILGVNGFNQPDVQDNKNRTNQKIASFRRDGRLDEGQVIWEGHGGSVYGQAFPGLAEAVTVKEVIDRFIRQAKEGDYIAINAYVPRSPETLEQLQALRAHIQAVTGRATTLGFGPRFLHSTGQLHKGGPNNGLFLQITQDAEQDISIPGQEISFGVLQRAQAIGDLEALLARGRRAIRVHLVGVGLSDLS